MLYKYLHFYFTCKIHLFIQRALNTNNYLQTECFSQSKWLHIWTVIWKTPMQEMTDRSLFLVNGADRHPPLALWCVESKERAIPHHNMHLRPRFQNDEVLSSANPAWLFLLHTNPLVWCIDHKAWVHVGACVCVCSCYVVELLMVFMPLHPVMWFPVSQKGWCGRVYSFAPPSWTHERRSSAPLQFILTSVQGWVHRGELWHFDARRRGFFSTEGANDQAGVLTCVLVRPEKTDGCFWQGSARGTNGGPKPSQHQKTLLR